MPTNYDLSPVRLMLGVILGALTVVPTAIVIELFVQVVVRLAPSAGGHLPIFFDGTAVPAEAGVLAHVFVAVVMLFGFFLLALVFCTLVGIPLLIAFRKLNITSTSLFFVICAGIGGSIDLLTHEPRLRGSLWLAVLLGTTGGAMHIVAKRLAIGERSPSAS